MQTVVIIGGTSGVGKALAQALHNTNQYQVIVTGRNQARMADLEKRYSGLQTVAMDMADANSIQHFADQDMTVDHLVLAGSSEVAWGMLADMPIEQIEKAMQVKAVGYLHVIKQLLLKLSAKASITLLGGAAGRKAMPGTVGLALVNGGLEAATRTLALELAPKRVNLVSPGLTDTEAYDGFDKSMKAAMFEGAAKGLPVGKTAKPDDIAKVVQTVIESDFMTGSIIDIDGGASL